jgi:hypothetical protein
MTARVSPGSRMSCPLADASKVPRHPPANAMGPQARRSAIPLARGRSRKPRSAVCETIRRPSQSLARLEPKHGQGNALTVLAHTWARAVYDRRKRDTVFDRQQCLNGAWRGAGEPTASLDDQGLSLACGALIIARRQGTRRSTSALWPRSLGR